MDDFLKFIDIVVWPFTTLTLAWFFKAELKVILSRISSLKYKGLEAKFGEELSQIEGRIGAVNEVSDEIDENKDRLDRLSEISPRTAIIEAWIELENVLFNLADIYKIGGRRPLHIIKELSKKGVISSNLAFAFNKMRKLRNEAAHAPDFIIDENEAQRFIGLSSGMALLLKKSDEIKKKRS